jgi:hypothetical protein
MLSACWDNNGNRLHVFFTFNDALEFMQGGGIDFMYPASFFRSLAEKYRFSLVDFSIEYGHPRGQKRRESQSSN